MNGTRFSPPDINQATSSDKPCCVLCCDALSCLRASRCVFYPSLSWGIALIRTKYYRGRDKNPDKDEDYDLHLPGNIHSHVVDTLLG